MPRQEQPDAFCNAETCRKIARVVLPGDGGQWCLGHSDDARRDYLARVDERVAGLKAAEPVHVCSMCTATPARLYLFGWRCDTCAAEHIAATRERANAAQ